jgi:SAM-dependent methyltransferase
VSELSPAAQVFDAIATAFDGRFGEWRSVAAQRDAVRAAITAVLPQGADILELGGGTGEDAAWLAQRGYKVLLTDASPAMVAVARGKLAPFGAQAEIVPAEDLEIFAQRRTADGGNLFDGVISNFAPLNCVGDLAPVGRGLAGLVKPGGSVLLVLFGTASPGDMLVECLRGRPQNAPRRLHRGPAPARLGGRHFTVTYHRGRDIARALAPWFRPVKKKGIGIFVPPSAAEPWISAHPRLLNVLEHLDRFAARPLALLGDHVLYQFTRTGTPAP